ncbi:hypothetical protein HGM15179_007870 [Zosterops borbonicus]|uniref:Peptidase A2 domain-containing protein n=1 Tax=Zosterops borbonicus TaxID=364589 RepID=A0A8K1GIP4_9PASS|nr:hypothetical protein HGM15179_007870 [Zosterops borbonicus]
MSSYDWDSKEGEPEPGSPDHIQVPSRRTRGGNATNITWQSISQHAIRDLVKALKECGRDSLYFQGTLNAHLAGIVVVPFDLKHLFRCLTSKTEYKLWEATWKDLLKDTLPSLLKDPKTAKDGNGDELTLDHLSGEGDWALAPTQAAGIPALVLEEVKDAAERAFLGMQPLPPYSGIFQGPTEPYLQFVEKLIRAIDQQVRKKQAREEVLEHVAFANANERCRAAILTLPHKPPPTLQDMLQVMQYMVPLMGPLPGHQRRPDTKAATASTVNNTPDTPLAPHTPGQRKRCFRRPTERPCALCGKGGRWCQQCPLKKEFDQFRNKGGEGKSGEKNAKNQKTRHAIRDLVKALKECGRDSLYFQGTLNAHLAGIVVVPFDLKHLFRCLTSKTEYKLWEATWKDLLKDTLPSLLKDPKTAKDGNGDELTLDHLSGEGDWALAPTQAAGIPALVLEEVKDAAERAFLGMQPLPPYSGIFQGPTEPYLQFVEKLIRAIDQQVRKKQAREEVLEHVAFANANERCRAAILTLPHKPPPTLQDMLQVMQYMVPLMGPLPGHQRRPDTKAATASTVNNTPDTPLAPHTPGQRKRCFRRPTERPCALCGKGGRWCQQCPLKKEFDQFRNKGGEGKSGEKNAKNQKTRGQMITEVIPVPDIPVEEGVPRVNAIRTVREGKPIETCNLMVGEETKIIKGLLDTGADVMIIPTWDWLSVTLGPAEHAWTLVTEEHPTPKLNWQTDEPVWVEQWPLSKQKLKVLSELVEEELRKGNIEETTFLVDLPGVCHSKVRQDLMVAPPRPPPN